MGKGRLKCLTVIPGDESGSSMIFAKNQVKDIIALGIENHVFYLKSRTELSLILSEVKRLRKEVQRIQPDIIHCHYGTLTSFLTSLSTSKPLVITFHGSDINMAAGIGLVRNYLGHLMSQLSVLRASAVICVNTKIAERLWWGKKKATVIPMGIDPELFHPFDQAEAKERLGLDKDIHYVFFNGSNPAIKRTDIAKEVELIVKRSISNSQLLLLTGGVDPGLMPVYLNACDCLLLCSDSEGSPMVVKEAMACDLPVVSTDVGDVSERISGIDNCYVVPREPELLAEKIISIIKSGKRSNGRDRIQEVSSKGIASKIVDIYRRIGK